MTKAFVSSEYIHVLPFQAHLNSTVSPDCLSVPYTVFGLHTKQTKRHPGQSGLCKQFSQKFEFELDILRNLLVFFAYFHQGYLLRGFEPKAPKSVVKLFLHFPPKRRKKKKVENFFSRSQSVDILSADIFLVTVKNVDPASTSL